MLILDTDHMSILEWGGTNSAVLCERLAEVPHDEVATTIISYEEQMRSWMGYIAREVDGQSVRSLPGLKAAS
jgi:tRNA(fMet)-specific endonuclease VapC